MGKKVKVWKDVDEVVKASTIPKNKRKWFEVMTEIPKGEKASS